MARQYEDTETRRRQVAEAALQTIAEEGVSRFTTRAIAERVGISDGTLFRHFGSKEEIVLEAMSLLEAELEAGIPSTGDAMADLEAFFRHRAGFVGGQSPVGHLIFSDGLVHLAGETGRSRMDGWRMRNLAFVVDRFVLLREEGRVRADVDLPSLGLLFQGALLTFAMQASLGQSGSIPELEARIDQVWTGLHTLITP